MFVNEKAYAKAFAVAENASHNHENSLDDILYTGISAYLYALPVPTSEEPRITVGHRRAIGVVEAGIAGPMDWPEDFAHENGRYFNACHSCACIFVGHKRRVICRVCSAPIPPIREDVERAVEEHGEACYEVGFADADRDLREAPVARRNAARAHLLSLFPSGGTVPPAVLEAETGEVKRG